MIRVEKIQIPTLPTQKPRRLYIYTPKGYEQNDGRYPVLYMFDGHNVFYVVEGEADVPGTGAADHGLVRERAQAPHRPGISDAG